MDNNNYSNRQGKLVCNGTDVRRNPGDIQISQQILDSGNQNVGNLLFTNSQASTSNPLLTYQSSSFGGLYTSPGFNSSLSGYENNIQWLTDSRMQNQHNQLSGNFIADKNINSNSHSLPPTTSHSCCVNRFGVLDSLAVGSPMSNEQIKSSCDVSTFQNKSNLSMNIIDPIQSWLNLQIPNNQQYCKYGDRSLTQNYNTPVSLPSQINLPIIEQSDLKQSDLCMQSPDACFENVTNGNVNKNDNSSKQIQFSVGTKQPMLQESNSIFKHQGSYQSSIIPKDWKSTFQSMQNYISSPNMFNAVSDSQENFIFTQYNVPNSFYSSSENYAPYVSVSKNSTTCMTQTKSQNCGESNLMNNVYDSHNNSKSIIVNPKTNSSVNIHYNAKQIRDQSSIISQGITTRSNNFNRLSDCCQVKKAQASLVESNGFELNKKGHENKNIVDQNSATLDVDSLNNKATFKSPEGASSESEESNIIVEESDDIGEIESEISMEEIKKSYKPNETCPEEVLLRCLVCNVATSSQTPANHFIHMNDTFPVTSTRIPVRTKLEQILPIDLQHYLKVHNSFMCRRCLTLIETVELLEVNLISAKQTISDQFSKTIQLLMPEIEQLIQEQSNVSESLACEKQTKKIEPFVELEKAVENDNIEVTHSVSESESASEFQCCYCSKILSSQKTYNQHLQQHTNEFNFYCERCGKGFPLKSALERHLNWHNGIVTAVQTLCEICGDIFSSKHLFYSHQMKSHSRNYAFQCETCGKGFTRKVSLEIHRHRHTGIRSFICEYCGQTFISKSSLKSHISICTKDFPYKCDTCKKSFATEGQLRSHKSQHTGIYKLTCSVCKQGFNKPSHLKDHMVSHSNEKKYKCADCDKAFKTVFNLNYHLKVVHKQENVFKCSVCGKIFGQQKLLSDHMNSHTKDRPYKCEKCGKSFVHQTTFITHLKVHTGKVKSKTCAICGKNIKTRMSVHMRSHTGEKPYKCTYCPLAFSVGVSLKKHIKVKHCRRPA